MKKLLASILTIGLAACATPTPFEPANGQGYGFADQRIENDRFRISFKGNSLTTREQVETALLLRAAQVTLENGYDHFFVVSDDTETERRVRVTDLGPRFGTFGFYGFGPFPYYTRGFGPGFYPGFGPGFGGGFNDVQVRESQKYTAVAFIVLGEGPKPEGDVSAYDARDVQSNLSDAVFRREE